MEVLALDNEIWKDVIRYENLYQVSNLGRVKSKDRIYYYPKSNKKKLYKAKIKKQCETGKREGIWQGYLCTRLMNDKKESKCECVHVLVATAFIPNPDKKETVNHIDGNKHNNRAENLEWATYSENNQHAYDNNLKSDNKILLRLKSNKISNIFISESDAWLKTGISAKVIRTCINNKKTDYYGYNWVYFLQNKYVITYDDDVDGIRNGGLGSTSKK